MNKRRLTRRYALTGSALAASLYVADIFVGRAAVLQGGLSDGLFPRTIEALVLFLAVILLLVGAECSSTKESLEEN